MVNEAITYCYTKTYRWGPGVRYHSFVQQSSICVGSEHIIDDRRRTRPVGDFFVAKRNDDGISTSVRSVILPHDVHGGPICFQQQHHFHVITIYQIARNSSFVE